MSSSSLSLVLPADFGLPPWPHLLVLLGLAVVTLWLLYRRRPPVTEATVTALAPWMVAGGTLYALYQAGVVPATIAPLFGAPAVYVSVGVLAGLVWVAVSDRSGEGWTTSSAPGVLGLAGLALAAVAFGWAAIVGVRAGGLQVVWPGIAVLASLVVTAVVWRIMTTASDATATGLVGLVVVFGHALDGTSTAVGFDVLGFGEQTPLSAIVLEIGASLPGASVVGAGWLFVLVKLVLAAVVVVLFADYIRDEPTEGYLLLALVAAVGLGPGAHNVVLFAIA